MCGYEVIAPSIMGELMPFKPKHFRTVFVPIFKLKILFIVIVLNEMYK